MIEKFLKKLVSYGIRKYRAFKYSKFKPGHIFNITVDDMSFRMTFMDYYLDSCIIERIEGRREPETVAIIKSLVRRGGGSWNWEVVTAISLLLCRNVQDLMEK